MTSKLDLYRRAIRFVGSASLDSLSEDRAERYKIDEIYDGAVLEFLELGLWKVALRTSELTADTDTTADFGPVYVYEKPTDFVRLAGIATDAYFRNELSDYLDEAGYWYTDSSIIYVKYVSKGTSYGLNLGAWRETMAEACGAHLALKAVLPISKDRGDRNDLLQISARLLEVAKRIDAVDERVKRKPEGRLVQARRGFGSFTIQDGRFRF